VKTARHGRRVCERKIRSQAFPAAAAGAAARQAVSSSLRDVARKEVTGGTSVGRHGNQAEMCAAASAYIVYMRRGYIVKNNM